MAQRLRFLVALIEEFHSQYLHGSSQPPIIIVLAHKYRHFIPTTQHNTLKLFNLLLGMMVQTFNIRTQEAEAGGFLWLVWSTQ